MRMYDLIRAKRENIELSKEEIEYLVREYVSGKIPDYQMSAFLMAVYFNGMTKKEILEFTMAVANSGDMVDLSGIEGIKVDKHSTGGVGDKTTLIVAPIVAACGCKVAKMSGRGLGHTGGTVDKLESIPGLKTGFSKEEFIDMVNKIGIAVIGQSGNLAPADKKLYALRDVTATVDSIGLIAVSIMSKKLAAGSDCIVLDVKTGSGAFMKSLDESIELAKEMVSIGSDAGRKIIALISDMDIPLGKNIGNSLEVIEAVEVLNGAGPKDLLEVSRALAANILFLANMGSYDDCFRQVDSAIKSGKALGKLMEMVKLQGGDESYIKDTNKFEKARCTKKLESPESGYIYSMDTEGIGIASVILGAGREQKDSELDFAAGISIEKKTGDYVKEGEVLASLYAASEDLLEQAAAKYLASINMSDKAPELKPLILARVGVDGVERY